MHSWLPRSRLVVGCTSYRPRTLHGGFLQDGKTALDYARANSQAEAADWLAAKTHVRTRGREGEEDFIRKGDFILLWSMCDR